MNRRLLAMLLLLGGCGSGSGRGDEPPGNRLEAAAVDAGLVPASDGPATGVWAHDGDRMCVGMPEGRDARRRVGLLLDGGRDDRCIAFGTARPIQGGLELDLRRCRIRVRLDGGQAVLPDRPDPACARLCRGSATLSAVRLDRLSDSAAEAAAFRLPRGRTPCAG